MPVESDRELVFRCNSLRVLYNFESLSLFPGDEGTWIGDETTKLFVPNVMMEIPDQIKQLADMALEVENGVSVDRLGVIELFDLARRLSRTNDNVYGRCNLVLNEDGFSCIPSGNQVGQGIINIPTVSSSGSFETTIRPLYIEQALRNCINDQVIICAYEFQGIETILIVDNDITHLISQLGN